MAMNSLTPLLLHSIFFYILFYFVYLFTVAINRLSLELNKVAWLFSCLPGWNTLAFFQIIMTKMFCKFWLNVFRPHDVWILCPGANSIKNFGVNVCKLYHLIVMEKSVIVGKRSSLYKNVPTRPAPARLNLIKLYGTNASDFLSELKD